MSASSLTEQRTRIVKELSDELGFLQCGISSAGFLKDDARELDQWLKKGRHGSMNYMENHYEKRLDPTRLVPGARSVISLLYNYTPKNSLPEDGTYKIARYAYGKDYHFVIKDLLHEMVNRIREQIGDIHGRVFVDSAPVMERSWAAKSGTGWIGKNSLLLNRNHGSYFFLAEIISDLELIPDGPIADYCGTCTACMDACPTDAIPEPYSVDASKCISYLTIELKDRIPGSFKGQMNDWVFGCDICQEVCPWNRFAHPHSQPAFDPPEALKEWERKDWEELTEEVFKEVFRHSPLKRAKFEGLKRNIRFARE